MLQSTRSAIHAVLLDVWRKCLFIALTVLVDHSHTIEYSQSTRLEELYATICDRLS